MSTQQSPTRQALEEIRTDEAVRADVETLAERGDQFGALARTVLAIADGDVPDEEDCREAGLPSLPAAMEAEQ